MYWHLILLVSWYDTWELAIKWRENTKYEIISRSRQRFEPRCYWRNKDTLRFEWRSWNVHGTAAQVLADHTARASLDVRLSMGVPCSVKWCNFLNRPRSSQNVQLVCQISYFQMNGVPQELTMSLWLKVLSVAGTLYAVSATSRILGTDIQIKGGLENIRTMFRWPFFLIPMDSHSRNGCIVPQQNFSRNFTASAQLSVTVTDQWKTPSVGIWIYISVIMFFNDANMQTEISTIVTMNLNTVFFVPRWVMSRYEFRLSYCDTHLLHFITTQSFLNTNIVFSFSNDSLAKNTMHFVNKQHNIQLPTNMNKPTIPMVLKLYRCGKDF